MSLARIFYAASCCIAIAISTPIEALEMPQGITRSCIASIETQDGEWIATRNVTELGGQVVSTSRDTFDWNPSEAISFGKGALLRWSLGYYWPTKYPDNTAILDSDVSISLHFEFKAEDGQGDLKKPDRTWLRLYRSTDLNDRHLGATYLASEMWWDKFSDKRVSGKTVIPLDHLLSFGQGFDLLAWEIHSAPNRFGATDRRARGTLPIAAMRQKTGMIRKLRKSLDKKAARYKQECDRPITVAQ